MLRTSLAAAALLVFGGLAQAQQTPGASKPNPSAATSTSPAEMNRGVPGVNVDVGRGGTTTSGAEMNRGVPGVNVDVGTDARGRDARGRARAPRAAKG